MGVMSRERRRVIFTSSANQNIDISSQTWSMMGKGSKMIQKVNILSIATNFPYLHENWEILQIRERANFPYLVQNLVKIGQILAK